MSSVASSAAEPIALKALLQPGLIADITFMPVLATILVRLELYFFVLQTRSMLWWVLPSKER